MQVFYWREVIKNFGLRGLTPNQVAKLSLEEFSKRAAADTLNKKGGESGKTLKDFNSQGQLYRATNYPSREAGDIHDLGLHSGTELAAQERADVRRKLNPDVKIVKVEKITNPAVVTKDVGFKTYESTIDQLVKDGFVTKEEKIKLDKNKDMVDVRKLLQSKGYDGIIFYEFCKIRYLGFLLTCFGLFLLFKLI